MYLGRPRYTQPLVTLVFHTFTFQGRPSEKNTLYLGKPLLQKQARKSSADAQAAGLARFEKVWAR